MGGMGPGTMGTATGAVNPATLDAVARLCRVCGTPNPVIFRLRDRTELISRVETVLGLKIELEEDKAGGFPGVVCRKCCNLVETFFHFQKSVREGQETLKKQVEERKKRDEEERLVTEALRESEEEARLRDEGDVESIGVDPLDESILPDAEEQPDTKVGNIRIKQESLRTTRNSSQSTTAPMTTVFTDAVPEMTIKIEPGLRAMKKEAGEGKEGDKETETERDDLVTPEPTGEEDTVTTVDSTVEITPMKEKRDGEESEEASGVVGELFSQLVGEVEKINEGVRTREDETKNSDEREDRIGEEEVNEHVEKDDVESKEYKEKNGNAMDPESEKEKTNGDDTYISEDAGPSKQSDDWLPDDALEEDLDQEEYYDTNGAGEGDVEGEGDVDGEEEVEGEGDEGPLVEMDDENTNPEGETDDFGGYDPLKLAQMSADDLNELDFEMDDNVDTEDHDIFDEHSVDAEGEEALEDEENKDGEVDDEEGGLSENVHTDYDMDYTEEDEEDHSNLDVDGEVKNGEEDAEDTLDDSKEDTVNDDAFDLEVPKNTVDRSYNDDENLNEDCDDDMEPGEEDTGPRLDDSDCINDDNLDSTKGEEDCGAAPGLLSEDLSSDNVEGLRSLDSGGFYSRGETHTLSAGPTLQTVQSSPGTADRPGTGDGLGDLCVSVVNSVPADNPLADLESF